MTFVKGSEVLDQEWWTFETWVISLTRVGSAQSGPRFIGTDTGHRVDGSQPHLGQVGASKAWSCSRHCGD